MTGDRVTAGATAHEERAEHFGLRHEETVVACRRAFGENRRMIFLAHLTGGVPDFSIDRLGEEQIRHNLLGLSRTLVFSMSMLDTSLAPSRSGGLIRAVLHTMIGAAVCTMVVPRQHVVGIVQSPAVTDIQHVDSIVSTLTTACRREMGLESTNPGGWETAGRAVEPTHADPVATDLGATPPEVREAAVAAVRTFELHAVAYCVDDEVLFMCDHLDAPHLRHFMAPGTTDARRRFYRQLAAELGGRVRSLNRMATNLLGGLLHRVVLDVEHGAVYFYRLSARNYLMGVTLSQDCVNQADVRMATLAGRLRKLLPAPPDEPVR